MGLAATIYKLRRETHHAGTRPEHQAAPMLFRVAPSALLGIPSAALRLPRVAPLALLGIPSAALQLESS